MPLLSPSEAASAAQLVYNVKDNADVQPAFAVKSADTLREHFEFVDSGRFSGISGGLVAVKQRTGFGVMAKGTGIFKDDVLIAARGTTPDIHDFLTDGDIGLRIGVGGHMVHAGFHKTFSSFEDSLRNFLKPMNPRRVHCVGHSLGGALATLIADWLSANNIAPATLYTFGSPRVGLDPFASSVTTRLSANQVFRVHHKTDIVSMVPIWPFSHVPLPGSDCYIESPGSHPGGEYHRMERYISSVRGFKNWEGLLCAPAPEPADEVAESWLSETSPLVLSTGNVVMIGKALRYVLKKALKVAAITLQIALSTTFTLVDALARILARAAEISKEVSGYVVALMRRILAALGRNASFASPTADLIAWALQLLTISLYRIARGAITAVEAAAA